MSATRRQSAQAEGGCSAPRPLTLRAAAGACRNGTRALLAPGRQDDDMAAGPARRVER